MARERVQIQKESYRSNQYSNLVDREFKTFLAYRGFNIDSSIFDINLSEPMNFAGYREIELDSNRISSFTAISGTEYMSKRFMMKKYLGLTDLELKENEQMWFEEQGEMNVETDTSSSDLRNVGISSGDIGGDLDNIGDLEAEEAAGEEADLDSVEVGDTEPPVTT